jgi:hypothetical protein
VDNYDAETGQCQTALRAALRGSRSALALALTATCFGNTEKGSQEKNVEQT